MKCRTNRLSIRGFAAIAAALAIAAPATASWQPATEVPASTGVTSGSATAAGLADDGAAAIAYVSESAIRVATRGTAGGPWAIETLESEALGSSDLQLEMNAAGDAVAAWRLSSGSGFIAVAYRPAGGAWEERKFLDDALLAGSGHLDVAINSRGDAIVGWSAAAPGSPPQNVIRAVIRAKAGPWPALDSYATVVSEDDLTTAGTILGDPGCQGPAVAIDDAGNAIAAWSSAYGSFSRSLGAKEQIVCGVRTARWNGASWGIPANLTARPAIGYMLTSGGTPAPSAGTPVAAADPVSGKLVLAFRNSFDAIDGGKNNAFRFSENWSSAIYGGTVAAGPGAVVETPSIGSIGELAVGVGGSNQAVSTWESDGIPGLTSYAARAGSGAAGSPLSLAPLTSEALVAAAADAGGDGRAFAVFEDQFPTRRVLAWTAALGQGFAPTGPLFTGITATPSLAANCHGDAIVAAGGSAGALYADYLSGETGACGSGAGGGGGGPAGTQPSAGGTAGPLPLPGAGPPGNVIKLKAPISSPDGGVVLVVTFPGAGIAALKGTAKVDSAQLARVSAKRTIVVTRKTVTVRSAGSLSLKLVPTAVAKQLLSKQGRLTAQLAIAFTPTGGSARTVKRDVTFKLPRSTPAGG